MNEDALQELRAHERECAIRYENIETQMEESKDRFTRIENMITGLYGIIITGGMAIFGVISTLAFNLM